MHSVKHAVNVQQIRGVSFISRRKLHVQGKYILKLGDLQKDYKLLPKHWAARRNVVENYGERNMPPYSNSGMSTVMVWKISMNGKTPFHVFPVTLSTTTQVYVDILRWYVIPHAKFVPNNFILMVDHIPRQ